MKKKILAIILGLVLAFGCVAAHTSVAFAYSEQVGTEKAHILMDFDSGTVVSAKNENGRHPIASMVKITTLSLIFDAIKEGKLSYDDEILVSENAFSMGGSQAFLDKNEYYRAEELIKSIIVASANDSCVAMAEHLCGSVESFVEKMNEKARELDMQDTNYVNCTGLPASGGYSSAKDVATITRYLMQNEKFFEYSKIWMYDIQHKGGRVTGLTNTNKLVRFYNGLDGGKTGFTNEAMYCLSSRATRNNTSLVCVVIGSPSSKARNARVCELYNYGFANYESKVVAKEGDTASSIALSGAKEEKVDLVYEKDVKLFGKKGEKSELDESVIIEKNNAPIRKGEVVGKKIFVASNGEEYAVNLVSSADVDELGFGDLIKYFAKNW